MKPRATRHPLDGHDAFRRTQQIDNRAFLQRLASEGQSPDALYIGCSDSRVVPELLTASSPGRLFVVRNIANLVPPLDHADASVGAALDYAVGVLRVPHIVICGHYGCGGVHAALDGSHAVAEHTSLAEWLAGIAPAIERAGPASLDPEVRWRRAVEENVLQQVANLFTYPQVARAIAAGELTLHAWVYDLFTLDLRVHDVGRGAWVAAHEIV